MATIKLNKNSKGTGSTSSSASSPKPSRPPVRGAGSGIKKRPTLAQAQAEREERQAARAAEVARGERDPRAAFNERPARPEAPASDRRRPSPPGRTERADDRPQAPRARPPRRDERPDDRRRDAPPGRAQARPAAEPRSPGPQRNTAFSPRPPGRPPEAGPGMARREPPARPVPSPAQREADDGSLRLSKRMSELGLASRREADEWIAKGWVRVDGRVVAELGSRVMPEQHITIDARARSQQAARVTVLINKPVGYVSGQAEDGYEPALVLVTPENQWREDRSGTRFLRQHLMHLAPAGRLDIDSVGLLVLTQDGRIAKQLIGEDSEVEKEYLVRVQSQDGQPLPEASLALLNHGLELDGEPLRPALVEWVNDDQLRFVLREGKKRQIRRMCEAVGLSVLGLKRVRIGSVMLGDLPAGQWRYLRMDESFG